MSIVQNFIPDNCKNKLFFCVYLADNISKMSQNGSQFPILSGVIVQMFEIQKNLLNDYLFQMLTFHVKTCKAY